MSHDVRVAIEIDATPARVLSALLDPADLRVWFCEEADVSVEDKRYDFWGRHTPETPGHAAGRHEMLSFEAARGFSYAWQLRGGDSRVAYRVEPAEGGSILDVHHALPRGRARGEGALTDFWAGALERLKAWIEKGVAADRVDYGTAPAEELRLTTVVGAPPHAVFQALTNPGALERWIAVPGAARVEPRVGGVFDIGWGDEGGPVKILAIEPDRLLRYSWRYPPEPDTVVTWSLEGSGGRTRLTIVHSGFADAELHGAYLMGWGFFLGRVARLVETGVGRAAKATADDYAESAS